jgi:hypothetical protein
MPWIGLAAAGLWWAGLAGAIAISVDLGRLGRQPPIALGAGALLALLPGILLIMAGLMARQGARSAASNALVLEAADRLLDPAAMASGKATTLADELTASADRIDRAMNHALGAMKALSGEIGDERLRLESVSYAAADNARDLAERLSGERTALESLARDIRAQTDAMSDAVPRQAELMVDAARQASEEFGRAETALDARLSDMSASAERLAGQLSKLEGMTSGVHDQSEALIFAVSRVEERIEQSRKMVDEAVRASDMAATAAGSTGQALQSAVSDALDGARKANSEINASSRAASAEAARALAQLREQAEEVGQAVRALNGGNGRDPDRLPDGLATVSAPPTDRPAVNSAPAPADPQIEAAQHAPAETMPSFDEAELFDTPPEDPDGADGEIDPFAEDRPAAAEHLATALDRAVTLHRDAGWGSILSDIERSDAGQPSREQTVETVIERLHRSGILLDRIFRPRDKKRIASAERRGAPARRAAIHSAAGEEVERVSKRLSADEDLARFARDFIDMEATDAILALEKSQKSNRNASPRLAAFLLLDTVLRQGEGL